MWGEMGLLLKLRGAEPLDTLPRRGPRVVRTYLRRGMARVGRMPGGGLAGRDAESAPRARRAEASARSFSPASSSAAESASTRPSTRPCSRRSRRVK